MDAAFCHIALYNKKIKNKLFKPKLYLLKILKRYFLLLIRSRKQKVMLILRRMCW